METLAPSDCLTLALAFFATQLSMLNVYVQVACSYPMVSSLAIYDSSKTACSRAHAIAGDLPQL